MLRSILLTMSVLLATCAAAETLPFFNLQTACRAAPSLTGGPSPFAACLKDEEDARAELGRNWRSYREADQRSCSQESALLPSPSYVALLVCLQMFSATDKPQ